MARIAHRSRVTLLLLLGACAMAAFINFRLLAWASSNSSNPNDADNTSVRGAQELAIHQDGSTFSLGPDAIPSVVLVEPRRLPSSLDVFGLSRPGWERLQHQHRESLHGCRNTVQGRTLLADSEGRVCPRAEQDVHRPGCCVPRRHADGHASLPSFKTSSDDTNDSGGNAEHDELIILPAGAPLNKREGDDSIGTERFLPEEALSMPFSCWTCDVGEGGSSCCQSYEFCVACCQDPRRADEREAIRAVAARSGHPAYRTFEGGRGSSETETQPGRLRRRVEPEHYERDSREEREAAFDHCALRCRTNSGSVAHENSFRGPLKHCFGRYRTPVGAGMSGSRRNRGETRLKFESFGGAGDMLTETSQLLQLDPLLSAFLDEKP